MFWVPRSAASSSDMTQSQNSSCQSFRVYPRQNVTFSRNGDWVAYVSYPDRTLWRSRSDGTERMQLVSDAVGRPAISPDGRSVLFLQDGVIYLIGMDGGERRAIVRENTAGAAEWSPDGHQIMFWTSDEEGHPQANFLDVNTGNRSQVLGSIGFLGSHWISDNKLLAVDEHSEFVVLDLKTRKWSALGLDASANLISRWGASPDHKLLYYTTGGANPELVRFGLDDRKSQNLVSLKDFHFGGFTQIHGAETQIGFTPDASPVFTRDIGTQEIYALSVKWP